MHQKYKECLKPVITSIVLVQISDSVSLETEELVIIEADLEKRIIRHSSGAQEFSPLSKCFI